MLLGTSVQPPLNPTVVLDSLDGGGTGFAFHFAAETACYGGVGAEVVVGGGLEVGAVVEGVDGVVAGFDRPNLVEQICVVGVGVGHVAIVQRDKYRSRRVVLVMFVEGMRLSE